MTKNSSLNILLVDPCYSTKGISNNIIPLAVGLIGSHVKKNFPQASIKILKLSDEIIKHIDNNKVDVIEYAIICGILIYVLKLPII